MKPLAFHAVLATLLGSACSGDTEGDRPDPVRSDVEVFLGEDDTGPAFGNLFRGLNLDAGKTMLHPNDFNRLARLMCPDPEDCKPGPLRYWDKVNFGRFTFQSPLTHEAVLKELIAQDFPVFWSMVGTPAFLRDSCSGCVIETDDETHHLLRELSLPASDPNNPLQLDINCLCEEDDWWAGPPASGPVGGVSWQDYIEQRTESLLTTFESEPSLLRIGLWNEPDQIWWSGLQSGFVSMWCQTAEIMRTVLGENSEVHLGGPDVSAWNRSIGAEEEPLLKAIQQTCGENAPYDFLSYHQYSEPGKLLFEESVSEIESWGGIDKPNIDVGEYAASLGYGAEAVSNCDPTAVALSPDSKPTPTGTDPTAILCDHRGAVEDVALAASMAEQDHNQLYRFEAWDWGTVDMVNSRMGLLTINHLPKPTATAFWMLSHLQGDRIAVINELGGATPYHLLASKEEHEIRIVVATQNRSVTDQFVRGLLQEGIRFSEDVAPGMALCPAFQTDDPEALLADLALAETTTAELLEACPELDFSVAESMATALAYAAPRAGWVDQPFRLTIDVEGWSGQAMRYRVDAYNNTFAESHRLWPDGDFAESGFDYNAAEEILWETMTTPIDVLESEGQLITLDVPPDSVTLLRLPKP